MTLQELETRVKELNLELERIKEEKACIILNNEFDAEQMEEFFNGN